MVRCQYKSFKIGRLDDRKAGGVVKVESVTSRCYSRCYTCYTIWKMEIGMSASAPRDKPTDSSNSTDAKRLHDSPFILYNL